MPVYTYSDLYQAVNGRIHNKMGLLVSPRATLNMAVREVRGIGIRSAKRKALMAPNMFSGVFQYACPTDLDGDGVISIQPQDMQRENDGGYRLTTEEEFDQRKNVETNLLAFTTRDMVRKLLASVEVDDQYTVVSNFDSLTDGGTWSGFGDGTNLRIDNDDYIKGSGSLKWDISAAAGTTAGVENTGLPVFDLTYYKAAGSVFVWAYITSATNLTNFILKIGNDSSNNYQMTATTTNEGTSFVAGWNLIRFDFNGKTTNGSVTDTTCQFVRLYMTKTTGKVSETDYRFDYLVLRRGKINNLIYYSKYMWQNNSGTYLQNSTTDTDYINCDEDEFNLFVEKGVELCAPSAREYDDYEIARDRYGVLRKEYKLRYKTESLPLTTTWANA